MQSRYPWILLCAGMNLILAQYWTMKEYLVVLVSSEATIILVMASFLASCSLGYLFSPKRWGRTASWVCLGICLLQLVFPWALKELAAVIYRERIPHITALLLGSGILVMAPLYTVLLPYWIGLKEGEDGSEAGEPGVALATCYGFELAGAALGVTAILTIGRWTFAPLLALYFVNVALILAGLFETRKLLYVGIPLALCYGLVYGPLDRAAVMDLYQARWYSKGSRLLASAQSIYNRIDVVQEPQGEKYLLLNRREFFNPTHLEAFNRYLAALPASLMPGSKVLIVGTGSLSSVYHASRSARSVESVEIDAQVVAITKELFREYNHLDQVPDWTLHIDDAKHFLGSSQEHYDLIIIDLVPPIYVQTALLYTREFYELVKQRLTPQGVLSIYTGSLLGDPEDHPTFSSPEKTIDAVFPEYLLVNSRDAYMGFVYASRRLPFTKQDVLAKLVAAGTQDRDEVFEPDEVRPFLNGKDVISMDDLRVVLEWNTPSSYRDLLFALGGRR